MTRCLVIYIGNGYSEMNLAYDKSYSYSVDMKENYQNHKEKIFDPLRDRGYSLDFALLTNKHKKYEEYVNFYNAIHLDYDDINDEEIKILDDYYFFKSDVPPGSFISGGRFLKLKKEIPQYDLYVIIRSDLFFKMSLNELNVNYEKMNWLWPETDYRVFCDDQREAFIKWVGHLSWPWTNHHRVNGNTFNIIPSKFFNVYSKYIWMEHTSFYHMLKDLKPLVTFNDINMMLGFEKFYVTDLRFTDNPVFGMNKKIIETFSDAQTHRYGVK